jgi:nitroreductase
LDLYEAIKNRRSVRAFTREDIPDSAIEKILEYGNLAPTAGNLQSRDFVIVKDPETKVKLAEAALGQDFVSQAPVVIVVCANAERAKPYQKRGEELYSVQDATASIQNILLTVHAEGYGACWVGAFSESKVSQILGLPKNVRPLAILPIGRPAEKPLHKTRVPTPHISHREKW